MADVLSLPKTGCIDLLMKKILIVDDDVFSRTLLIDSLSQYPDYEILEAADGLQAIELCRRSSPDLVVLDVEMPGLSGIDVAAILKTNLDIPFVFLSSHGGGKIIRLAADSGAMGYIVKPVTAARLVPAIEVALQRSSELKYLQNERTSLAGALDHLHKIASQVPGVVYQYRLRPDGSACFPFASQAIREIFRVSPEDVREDASPVLAVVHPDDYDGIAASIQESAQELTPWHHEYRVKFDDGTVRWLFGNAHPQREEDGAVLWHGFITDISERKQIEEQVHQLAFYDPLTRLPNRRLLNDRLSQTLATSRRSGCYGALMFLDLDNFKLLNDTHGHVVGDMLLIVAADRLRSCVREMDTVARFGGDEFVVMLNELAADKAESGAQALVVAEKIRMALSEPYLLTFSRDGITDISVEHRCTASIGVTLFINYDGSQDDILKWADTAMYRSKEAGRNLIRFYEQSA